MQIEFVRGSQIQVLLINLCRLSSIIQSIYLFTSTHDKDTISITELIPIDNENTDEVVDLRRGFSLVSEWLQNCFRMASNGPRQIWRAVFHRGRWSMYIRGVTVQCNRFRDKAEIDENTIEFCRLIDIMASDLTDE